MENKSSQQNKSPDSAKIKEKVLLVGSSSHNPESILQGAEQNKDSSAKYGSWMVATSRKPRKQIKPQGSSGGEVKDKNPKKAEVASGQKGSQSSSGGTSRDKNPQKTEPAAVQKKGPGG